MRDLLKEPLSVAELGELAQQVGSPRELVAPKRREEAEKVSDDDLLAWLAEDGGRVRRPILRVGNQVTLGFTEAARQELEKKL